MDSAARRRSVNLDFDRADDRIYKSIISAIDKYTGQEYLTYLVKFMADVMNTRYAFVTVVGNSEGSVVTRFRTLAYWTDSKLGDNIEYDLAGTPCELLVKHKRPKFYPKALQNTFPKQNGLAYESYHAVPLFNHKKQILGHLGVADTKPMPTEDRFKREALLRVLALRVESELARIHADEERDRLIQQTLQHKEKLEHRNEQLRTLNDEKNYFIKVLSHDLRSPLNHIRSMTELLDKAQLTEEQNNIIAKIVEMAEHSSTMVGKLLDVGYIEGHHSNFKFSQFDANVVITNQVYMFREAARAKGIDITLYKQGKNHMITADKDSFIQIFDNLMSNAIKFSPTNSKVSVGLKDMQECTRIEVTDKGPGIPKKDMDKLFGRFQKLSAQPTAGESSTGLGLSIAKRFTEEMGGRIWCVSTKGKGASFVVEFKK